MTQPLPLREQLKALEQLQELDLKIDVLEKKKGALPAALKTLDDSMTKANNAVTNKTNAIAELEKLQRQTEAAMELNRDRLNRSNGKLEGVHNTQEFTAANKEIEQLRKQSLTLEEQLKKTKTDIETARKDLEGLQGSHAKVKGDRDAQASVLGGQTGELDVEIDKLMQQRKQFTSQIDPRTVSTYDRVRKARGGVGFVPATGGRCSGCNMMVPPQLFNEIQRVSALHACPSCHRFLFVPGHTAPAPNVSAS